MVAESRAQPRGGTQQGLGLETRSCLCVSLVAPQEDAIKGVF